jgi:hypothetical protein
MQIKLNSISFLVITILFLLLPFSLNWRLLLFGNKAKGNVIKYRTVIGTYTTVESAANLYSVIHFETEKGEYVEFVGPENLIYPIGKDVIIFYDEDKPSKFLMFNFAGLVLTPKMVVPGVILILWLAFYLSIITSPRK